MKHGRTVKVGRRRRLRLIIEAERNRRRSPFRTPEPGRYQRLRVTPNGRVSGHL